MYNVIDSRQSYLQQLLKQALATMGFAREAEHSTHYAYEMVALSHATARDLGYEDSESSGKPFVEVSGRRGLGVKADDLLTQLIQTAEREVEARNAELPAADRRRIAQAIAIAAVRYFLVKFSRGKVIVFDIDEALSFEGETGPYIQYAAVRANNILAKLLERDGVDERAVAARLETLGRDPIEQGDDADELWSLILEAARLDEMVENSLRSLELSVIAKYAFGLAQAFNAFYHRQQILREEREDARLWRAAGVAYVRRQITQALALMGCDVPDADVAMASPAPPVVAVAWPRSDYIAALEQAGAVVREITPQRDPVPGALAACDGLLLTGGVDVDPAAYGDATRHPTVETDAERDAYELALARDAIARDLPVLAICRGVQILNVAAGGTLIQDIPSAAGTTLAHSDPRAQERRRARRRRRFRHAPLVAAPVAAQRRRARRRQQPASSVRQSDRTGFRRLRHRP